MTSIRTFLMFGVLATMAQWSSAAVYLLIPGVPGESVESRHLGWIDLSSMQVGVANKTCTGLTVTKNIDKSSIALSAAALVGGVYPSMTLEVTSEGAQPRTYLTYELSSVTVAATNASTGGGPVSESVSLQPLTLTMTYRPQLGDGSLGAPISYALTCAKK